MSSNTAPTPRTKILIGLFAGTLLAVAAVAIHQVWPLLHPTLIATAPLDPGCDLRQGPCRLAFDDGATVRLGIEPRSIPAATPLDLSVAITGLDTHAVEIDFVGVDMNMGYNRAALTLESPGLYRGSGVLPVCVSARMHWEARVLIHTPEGIRAAPFRFAIDRE